MKLETKELETIKDLNKEFSTLKVSLGDAELQKLVIVEKIQALKTNYKNLEDQLIKKYGSNSVIDLETGEVKQKEENG
jgi:flagellar biosynthesis chaperone FliJ|tara:strand:- start:1731 stop:1964 length:234 start_codon:yes stop_codon:yes gene_type:complete